MININILTRFNHPNFIHQLDVKRFGDDYSFYENSEKNIIWDLLVVYEGIKVDRDIKVKEGGLLFISGEPPMASVYPKKFLNQFDFIMSSHPKLRHTNNLLSHPALNWHFGFDFKLNQYKYTFGQLVQLQKPIKTKNISVISSNKNMMPGHNKRMKLIETLKNKFSGEIDFFGKGINPIDDKSDAILPYRFHICIENSFINDYWSEKFADPILGYSIPIYIGCKNIKDYFNENSFYNFEITDINGICNLISKIVDTPEKYYKQKINGLEESRRRLLNNYNLFPVLVDFLQKHQNNSYRQKEINLKPAFKFKTYKLLLLNLRLRRLSYKIYSQLLK